MILHSIAPVLGQRTTAPDMNDRLVYRAEFELEMTDKMWLGNYPSVSADIIFRYEEENRNIKVSYVDFPGFHADLTIDTWWMLSEKVVDRISPILIGLPIYDIVQRKVKWRNNEI